MLALCALSFRYIYDCADNLDKFSVCGELRVSSQFDIFNGSSGKYVPKLDLIVRLLAPPSTGCFDKPFAVIWMHALHDSFEAREAVKRIKPQNSISFI